MMDPKLSEALVRLVDAGTFIVVLLVIGFVMRACT